MFLTRIRFAVPFFFALCLFGFASIAAADNLRVIATGDSLTCQYYWNMTTAFDQMGVGAVVPDPVYGHAGSVNTARGGMASSQYTGQTPWPGTQEQINYSANVLAADPDVIVYMLGINNLFWGTLADNASAGSYPSTAFNAYKASIGPVFSQFANFTNSRGQHPIVLVGSILPFDMEKSQAYHGTTGNSGALDRIENWYNPWLRDQAEFYGFTYVDMWTAIQQDPDWKTKYMASHDGLHLSSQGSQWVATQFAQAVPEPSSLHLLAIVVGAFAFWWRFAR